MRVEVGDEQVEVAISGLDRVMALSGGVALDMSEVTGARVVPVAEAKAGLGWRVGGAYWPGWLATGWYTVPGRKGARQLWSVYRDSEVLVIDTTRERPSRLVLQHPDRHDLAWWIGERLGRAWS